MQLPGSSSRRRWGIADPGPGRPPGSDLPSKPGRGFCQYRPFFTHTTVLTAQPAYLLTLCAAQPISTPAFVTFGLCDPVADRLGGGFELTSQLFRSPSGANQGDAQTIWRRKAGGYGGLDFGMVDTSPPKGQGATKSGQLHLVEAAEKVGAAIAAAMNYPEEGWTPPLHQGLLTLSQCIDDECKNTHALPHRTDHLLLTPQADERLRSAISRQYDVLP